MLEILFKAQRMDNKEWVYGGSIITFYDDGEKSYYMPSNTERCAAMHDNATDNITSIEGNFYKVIPETICRCTGLQGKNGKTIFEGDIVKEKDILHDKEIQIKGKILNAEFEKGCWVIRNKDCWDFLQTNCSTLEIIGNIHDRSDDHESDN